MNIDEAVSDIRPYQFEPLLGTASVVFNEESSLVCLSSHFVPKEQVTS
jgi:hypothetical protein